jgi:N-acetylglucosaminyldiphosphoundecaprenol N-acetyl-beta-D-mannosaminyltransferase
MPRVNILGVGVSAINIDLALATITQWIDARTPHYVCVTPVHSVMECYDDEALRTIYNQAGMVTPDGMPIVWLSRFLGHHHVRRVYGPDLMLALCEYSIKRGYRHYFYGGAEGVAEQLRDRMSALFPGLQVAGCYTPPFHEVSAEEDEQIVAQINATQPDIVWIGLGAPKQEYWMAAHQGRLTAPVLIGVGAAFDFHTGRKKQAPRWMQRSGLEWVFRLMTEPTRLWQRYLYNNPRFLLAVFLQMTGLRHYSI